MGSGRETLTDRVLGGIAWQVVSQVVIQGARLTVGVVLARLLTPQQFGIAAMALVFSNLLTLFTDLSLGAALVQRAEITEEDRSTVFWTTAAAGVACSGFGVAFSGVVAGFFGQRQVGPLFAVLSIGFTLSALSATQAALLTRELAYRSLQVREMASVMIGAGVGIAAAVAGLGAWAIVAQALAVSAASLVLLWTFSPWRPRFLFSLESLRDLGSFGAKLFGSRLLTYANLNGDNLLVGHFLGSRALGTYALAYNVMFTPMLRIGLPLQQVVFPAYARLQSDPARLGAAWLRSKRLSAALLAPGFFAMLVVAPDLVPVVFGEQWHEAVPVLQLLCLAGVAHTLVTLNGTVVQARGQAGVLLRLNLLHTAVTVAAFAAGVQWGIVGVAACYAIAKWVLVLPDTWIACRSVSLRTIASLRASGTAVPLAAGASVLAYGLRMALVGEGVPAAVRLGLVLAFGLLVYMALMALAAPALVREVRNLLASVFSGGGAQSPAESGA